MPALPCQPGSDGLKIAFIRYRYDPFGGAERFTQMLLHSLAERGSEVHILARKWVDPIEPGITFHRIGGPNWPSLLGHASFVFMVGRAVRSGNFDLVQSNERTLSQHVYRAGDGVHARWLELRSLRMNSLRRLSIRLNPFHTYRLWLERKLFEHHDLKAVIVNSEMVRNEILSRFSISNDRIYTIYNGVDLDRFHPAHRASAGARLRTEQAVDDKTPIVLFVGSGFERKGLAPLMEGVALAGGDARLWVVGKGKTRPYEKMAQKLGIAQRIIFFGPRQDVAPYYAAADIFVLPTLYDPFPTAVLEAMAAGLPVVTTRQCGAAEIITQGQEGFIVSSPFETSEMASHLESLFRLDTRRKMAVRARKLAENFSTERTIGELEALYGLLLTGSH
jgi:UDP-glucose:(heptosyl)LPS alpha-1,3-glucosyltransferase